MKYCRLLLLTLAVVSCAPPYSAELNSSAKLAGQMTLIGTIGPVKSPDGSSTTAVKFLPIKPTSATTTLDQLSAVSGFLVSESADREGLTFAYDSGDGVQVLNTGASFSLAGADSNYPFYEYDVIETTTTADIIVFHLDGTLSGSFCQLFTANTGTSSFQSAAGQSSFTSLYGSQTPVAVQQLPLQGADKFNFLITDGSVTGSELMSLSGPSFGTGAIFRTVTVPSGIRRMLYFRGLDDVSSYYGYNSGGKWIWSRWDGSAFTSLGSVSNRIDAVLTDGDLISTQDGTLTIYDLNGVEMNSVPLGGMQFCYEAYVGTTPYVFFSVSYGFPHQSWDFGVYAIPTSKLRGLKG